jgi:hypothetical protein
MTKLLVLVAAVLVLAAGSAFAGLSSGTPKKAYIDNCGKHVMHPKKLVTACGDGNYYLAKLKWKHWGHKATTAGGWAHANLCQPNCAAGKFHTYKVAVKASKLRACHGRRDYTRLTVYYTKHKPKGYSNPERIKLDCV